MPAQGRKHRTRTAPAGGAELQQHSSNQAPKCGDRPDPNSNRPPPAAPATVREAPRPATPRIAHLSRPDAGGDTERHRRQARPIREARTNHGSSPPRSIALTDAPHHRRQPTRLRARAHTGREAGRIEKIQSVAITSQTEASSVRSCPPEPRKGKSPENGPYARARRAGESAPPIPDEVRAPAGSLFPELSRPDAEPERASRPRSHADQTNDRGLRRKRTDQIQIQQGRGSQSSRDRGRANAHTRRRG